MGILGSFFGGLNSALQQVLQNAPAITELVGGIGVLAGGGKKFQALAGLPIQTKDPQFGPINQIPQFPSFSFAQQPTPLSQQGGFGPVVPLRSFQTPGDQMGLVGSSFFPQILGAARAVLPQIGRAVGRQLPALGAGAVGAGIAGQFLDEQGQPTQQGMGRFRQTTGSVVPVRQLHAINPMTGNLETWLHAGRPTRWSRVNVKSRRHHHHRFR